MSTATCEKLVCSNHVSRPATWRCVGCQGLYCDDCINTRKLPGVTVQSCKSCGEICKNVAEERVQKAIENTSFFDLLPSAFSYPLKGKGPALLVVGVVFFGIIEILSILPLGALTVGVIGAGYLTAYIFKIICESAVGNHEIPNWPDVSNIHSDIIDPLKCVFMTSLVSFAPAIVFFFLGFKFPVFFAASLLFVVVGMLYYPMALIAAALSTTLYFNPRVILSTIAKVPGPYFVACAVIALIAVINFLVWVQLMTISVLLGAVVGSFLSFYVTIVEMRILGLIYYTNQKKFGWFS